MLYGTCEKTLKIDGTEMDYVTFGKGEKTLILLPGLSLQGVKGNGLSLAYMYRIFAKKYKVYVLDRKRDIPEGYTVRDMAEDTAKAMDMLGLSHAHIFGVSQGGMIAQYLAAEHPRLADKLVLAVTLSRQNETVERAVGRWVELAGKRDHRGLVADILENMYSEAYVRRYRWLTPVLAKIAGRADLERFAILAKACLTCDVYKELSAIRCPVLVLGGRQDRIVTGEASEEIAEALHCDLYMYDGLGHAAYEEAKDFNRRVYDFLKS